MLKFMISYKFILPNIFLQNARFLSTRRLFLLNGNLLRSCIAGLLRALSLRMLFSTIRAQLLLIDPPRCVADNLVTIEVESSC